MSPEHASRIIPDLERNALLARADQYLKRRIQDRGQKPTTSYHGDPVYQIGDGGTVGYIFLVQSDQVVYFVQYKRIRHDGFKLGRQVLLVKKEDADVGGFTQYVFFNILLKKYGALIADKEQSRFGAKFWQNAIIRVLDTKQGHVYAYDRRTRPSKLHEIKSHEDVTTYKNLLWGTTNAHELTFAVISLRPLSLSKNPRAPKRP